MNRDYTLALKRLSTVQQALLCLLLISVIYVTGQNVVFAQNATPEATPQTDSITQSTITYGQVVEDTLTQTSFFDRWLFYGVEGDQIIVRMVASDGLAPLLGIVDSGENLIIRSDVDAEGVQSDAPVNGVSQIDFVLPATGEYALVATRVGNENGTTTGSYSLALTLAENADAESTRFQEVVFRCGAAEIVSAASIELSGEPGDEDYRITVYGLDGFTPYIRVDVVDTEETLVCSNEVGETTDQQIMLPDEGELTVDQENIKAAQLALGTITQSGVIRVIIGSADGAAGRFYAVIEGAAIQPEGNFDRVNLLPAPRARDETLLLYMLRNPRTRIDPQISYVMEGAAENEDISICDDAGRFDCEQVPTAQDYRFPLTNGEVITGDNLSAGVAIQSSDLLYAFAQLRNRSTTTTGAYTILLMGTLPALMVEGE
jgi:hypothetical protein